MIRKKQVVVGKVNSVSRILAMMYGERKRTTNPDCVDELIFTILSQNTSDKNRDKAFSLLKKTFPAWEDLYESKVSKVARAIRSGGLSNVKSKRILKILGQIRKVSKTYDLSFLKTMSDEDVWNYLLRFEGVGPKTAACVMLFSLGRNVMPIDTHVYRVGERTGIIPDSYSPEKAHRWFMELKLPLDLFQLHLNMIEHGRTLCRPKNPKCLDCSLKRHCDFWLEGELKK